MNRDSLRAKALTINGGFYQVGHVATAGIAQSGYFIDIYA
jgi:hypothetical protein